MADGGLDLVGRLDRLVGGVVGAGRWLVLPVTLLLFLQWPLRDLLRAHSREANDLAQWLFALYVALAVPHATRARAHLATDAFAHRFPAAARGWLARAASVLFIAPWALFVLVIGWPMVSQSVRQLESFPDTFNPGYFLVKAGAWALALLMLAQAAVDAARGRE